MCPSNFGNDVAAGYGLYGCYLDYVLINVFGLNKGEGVGKASFDG